MAERRDSPRWARELLARLARPERVADVLGDLEEAHRRRVGRRGRVVGTLLTHLDALDMARVLLRDRAAARFGGLGVSLLDFKLGVRMLVKHPALTVVGVVTMAFGIAFGSIVFQMMTDLYHPDLRLDESDRVVELDQGEDRQVLHDFVTWREELGSVDDLSAYRTVQRNVISERAGASLVRIAEISPSAFSVARVPPLVGRTLVDADEEPGAPDVIVLGYDVWRAHFGADRAVVGQVVRVGDVPTTVVGVMPEGFTFPISHEAWSPLRLRADDYPRGQAPPLDVFGRLAPGVSLEEAQAKLTTLGLRAAAAHPTTNARRRPQVRPYRGGIMHGTERVLTGAYSASVVMPVLILVLVSANIALLVFARTAARESEIAVRSALGASRGRVVLQLFVEALVLAAAAAAVGLFAADALLGHVSLLDIAPTDEGNRMPYWFHHGMTRPTVLYAGVFTVLGALLVGVVPALRVTRGGLRTRLTAATAGGGGLRMSGLWSGVIVTQVAVTLALVPFMALFVRYGAPAFWPSEAFSAGEYLWAAPRIDPDASPAEATTPDAYASLQELERRLLREPRVRGVTFALRLPGLPVGTRPIEVDEPEGPRLVDGALPRSRVDADFFDVFEVPIESGRGFTARDVEADARVMIVNDVFVHEVLGDQNPIGRRIRFPVPRQYGDEMDSDNSPWYEIVGLVRDAPLRVGFGAADAQSAVRMYTPLSTADAARADMAVRTTGDAASVVPRVRALAADVDPRLLLAELGPMDDALARVVRLFALATAIVTFGTALALLLASAGIYSAISFGVARRTREIGIRVALGARRRTIVGAVLGRSLVEIVAGLLAGAALLYVIMRYQSGEGLLLWDDHASGVGNAEALRSIAVYAAVMLGVCALAWVVPARRALGIEPTEALRADG